MNVWFGADRPDTLPHVPVPVGATCLWCDEPIGAADTGWGQSVDGPWMHIECFSRQLFGSVGHQLELCPCHGGTYEDPEHMPIREAARAAWDLACQRASLALRMRFGL